MWLFDQLVFPPNQYCDRHAHLWGSNSCRLSGLPYWEANMSLMNSDWMARALKLRIEAVFTVAYVKGHRMYKALPFALYALCKLLTRSLRPRKKCGFLGGSLPFAGIMAVVLDWCSSPRPRLTALLYPTPSLILKTPSRLLHEFGLWQYHSDLLPAGSNNASSDAQWRGIYSRTTR